MLTLTINYRKNIKKLGSYIILLGIILFKMNPLRNLTCSFLYSDRLIYVVRQGDVELKKTLIIFIYRLVSI